MPSPTRHRAASADRGARVPAPNRIRGLAILPVIPHELTDCDAAGGWALIVAAIARAAGSAASQALLPHAGHVGSGGALSCASRRASPREAACPRAGLIKEISMIGYVTLGTNDLPRATRFYDELAAVMGAKRGWESPKFISWTTGPSAPMLLLIKPNDGKAATVGNGTMVALAASSKEQVAAIHRKALELGGKDEGPVGPRGEDFYAGYFRDLDGNKLCAYLSA